MSGSIIRKGNGGLMGRRIGKYLSNKQNGFTLIELLVVVAILGVLAAVAIPNVSRFIDKGKQEAKETELVNVQDAVTAYMSNYHFGYATDTGLSTGTAITTDILPEVGLISKAVHGTYTIEKDGTVTQTSYP